MPTYTYECQDCGHRYDAFQSMKDEPHQVCPECKGRVERLIGAGAGIVFKGSGFYVTDYRKGGGGAANAGGAQGSASGGSSGGAESGGTSSGASSQSSSGSGTSATTAPAASSGGTSGGQKP